MNIYEKLSKVEQLQGEYEDPAAIFDKHMKNIIDKIDGLIFAVNNLRRKLEKQTGDYKAANETDGFDWAHHGFNNARSFRIVGEYVHFTVDHKVSAAVMTPSGRLTQESKIKPTEMNIHSSWMSLSIRQVLKIYRLSWWEKHNKNILKILETNVKDDEKHIREIMAKIRQLEGSLERRQNLLNNSRVKLEKFDSALVQRTSPAV